MKFRNISNPSILTAAMLVMASASVVQGGRVSGKPWELHVVSDRYSGADGVKLCDANNDGNPDIVTGWEEGGKVTLCINPGYGKSGAPWAVVAVGDAPDVEDAVPVDLDGDGAIDIVSFCEGGTRAVFIHWSPADTAELFDAEAWTTELISESREVQQWMFCQPLDIDGKNGVDLVAAGKNQEGSIGWFEAPEDPRNENHWKWHPLGRAGWVMSILPLDMDIDGDQDILLTDRKGPLRGCRWLENPGLAGKLEKPWENHFVGGREHEVMFMTVADLDADGADDLLVAQRPASILWYSRDNGKSQNWRKVEIFFAKGAGNAKSVTAADLDLDGQLDLVVTCEHSGGKSGVFWMKSADNFAGKQWSFFDISGPLGTKYDLACCLDLDGDGDLDVLTCEERENLGIIWYENPTVAAGQGRR